MAKSIKEDDADAVSTKAGWVRWKRTQATLRAGQQEGGPDVPNARFYAAAVKNPAKEDPETGIIFLECERWTDAKKVAVVLFSGVEVDVKLLPPESVRRKPERRVQVRWGGQSPYARIQYRWWNNAASASKPWTNL